MLSSRILCPWALRLLHHSPSKKGVRNLHPRQVSVFCATDEAYDVSVERQHRETKKDVAMGANLTYATHVRLLVPGDGFQDSIQEAPEITFSF